MGRIATNTNWQLETLKQRGMVLDYPDKKVKEILLDIGYYRLGFYWNPFETNGNHKFRKGTKLSDVVKLYYLDVDLRNLLLKYIKRIEINFKTKLIYYVSNKYKDSPTWFIDPKVISATFLDRKSTRLNSSHVKISYAVFCLKKIKNVISELSNEAISRL